MPLDRNRECRSGLLDRLDHTVSGGSRHNQIVAQPVHRLMMPGIHFMLTGADNFGELAFRRHMDLVRCRMPARFRVFRPHSMHISGRQMLDQCAIQSHVEQLKSATDPEHWKIGRQRLPNQAELQRISQIVRSFAFSELACP